MSTGWEKYEPSPIEFFHGELMNEFHEYRRGITNNVSIKINGNDLNNIIAKAKRTTYEKYRVFGLDKAILKSKFINNENKRSESNNK